MVTIFGWFKADADRASCSSRWSRSTFDANAAGRILIATSRPRRVSRARSTAPIPPCPGGARTSGGSGDLVLGALAACAQITCQMVATAMGVPAERIEVTVTGELDLRGTLGISRDVPVGFETIRLHFDVDAPGATPDQLRSLKEKTEQYCVVMQTLTKPPRLETEWSG